MIIEKKCTGCQEVKGVENFSKWSRGKDGYQNYCKFCNRKYLKKFNVDYLPARRAGDQTLTGSYLNHIWLKMIKRTSDPTDTHWEYYGGRGIFVCDRWLVWENFVEDMSGTYEQGLSIERIDVNKGYSPDNCKWIKRSEQAYNKTNTVWVTKPDGEVVSLALHCLEVEFSQTTAYDRFTRYGDNYERIFCPYTIRDWCYEDAIKVYISENMTLPTKDVIAFVEEHYGITLTSQYIRQAKSDWKRGKPSSVMFKLFGPYEEFFEKAA